MKTKMLKRVFSLVMAVTMLFTMNSLPMFTAYADEPECEHWYDYDCQQYCSGCGEFITPLKEHTTDGDCDEYCNECYEWIEPKDSHTYAHPCSEWCEVCSEWREAEAGHTYDDDCDEYCNECEEWREAPHRYADNCDPDCEDCADGERVPPHEFNNCEDTTCIVCGRERQPSEHTYDNEYCDADCNVCGFEREVEGHQYDYDCSEYCNNCGEHREVEHTYDNDCDVDCNVCYEWRDIEGHQYDNDCDEECNNCGEIREVYHSYEWGCERYCNICNAELVPEYDHEYYSDCASKCMNCGEERDKSEITAEHEYAEFLCSTQCLWCYEKRENDIPHTYENTCDEQCDVCNEYRSVEHTYTDECDDECDVEGCGAWREAPHYVDSVCDDECNKCGAYIEATHYFDDDCDAYCENCELTREPPHYYENGCDNYCDSCGETREVEGHQYDNDCDEYCNNCNEHREGEHDFDENGFCKNNGCYQQPEISQGKYDVGSPEGYDQWVYEIKNAGNLYWFAQHVNSNPEDMEYVESENQQACAVLLNDIVVNENVIVDGKLSENTDNFKNWPLIGLSEVTGKAYNGFFDGRGHKISGLYCNHPDKRIVGLFGGSFGSIRNIGIVDSYFNGDEIVGSVCGYNYHGRIDNCYNDRCIVSGNSMVGGIVGANCYEGDIYYAYNTGSVSGVNNVGGIVGYAFASANISDSYNVGSVSGVKNVGGICGSNGSHMHNGFVATSNITGNENVGAICGEASSDSIIDGWYYDSDLFKGDGIGFNDVANYDEGFITALSSNEFEDGRICFELNSGNTDEPHWRQTLGVDKVPKLLEGSIVYHNTICDGVTGGYSNNYTEIPPHIFDDDNDNECNRCHNQRIISSITYKDNLDFDYVVFEKHTMVNDMLEPDVPPVTGYDNLGWSMDFYDAIDSALAVADKNVEISPMYENKGEFYDTNAFCVGIDGELGMKPLSTHTRRAGTMAQFEAIDIDGYTFIGWASSADATEPDLGTSNTYEVKVVQDKNVYALYSQIGVVEEKPIVAITDKGVVTEYGYEELFFTATRSIPDGFTLVEYGILAAKTEETGTEDNLIIGGEGVLQRVGQLNDNGAFTLFVNIDGDHEIVIYARGYLIYEKDGEQFTVYSDIESGSFDTLSITVEEDINA